MPGRFPVVVVCLIAGVLLLWQHNITSQAAQGQNRPLPRPGLVRKPRETSRFTLLTQVFDRVPTLRRWVSHYDALPSLDVIVIVWNAPIPSGFNLSARVPVINYQSSINSMNNRFLPRAVIQTTAVFLIDDDLYIDPQDVEFAFSVWRSHPAQIVGFLPRAHRYNEKQGSWHYLASPHSDGHYSMVLAGASVFHNNYMKLYSSPQLQPWRAVVDKLFNCDDILLNIVIANFSHLPPLLVEGTVIDLVSPQLGLSFQRGWQAIRSKCLDTFAAFMNGSLPLRDHNLVVRRRQLEPDLRYKSYFDNFYRHPELDQPYPWTKPNLSNVASFFDNSLVSLNDNYLGAKSNPWTIEFWLGVSLLRRFQAILGLNVANHSTVLVGVRGLRLLCCCPSGGLIQSLKPFSAEGFSHVAVVYDTVNCSLFVNGKVAAYAIVNSSRDHQFCERLPDNRFWTLSVGSLLEGHTASRLSFEGFLQELRVWKVARSRQELLLSFPLSIARHPNLYLRLSFGNDLTESSRFSLSSRFSAAHGVSLELTPPSTRSPVPHTHLKRDECALMRRNGVAMVLPSFVRPQNVPRILLHLARSFHGPLNEVIIVNSNPNISFSVQDLTKLLVEGNPKGFPSQPSRCTASRTFPQVTVLNSGTNLNTKAKYVGCLASRQPVCFLQDDDFYPTLSNALYSSFLLAPDTIHAETDTDTFLMNRKWSFIDTEIGLETGFTWFGCGSFIHRNTATRILEIMERFNISPHVMDPSAAILLNKIPVVFPTELNSTGLSLAGGFACPDCTFNRRLIEEARHTALKIIVSHLSQGTTDKDFSRASACAHCQRVSLTGCSSDMCILLSNVDIVTALIARVNFTSLNGSYYDLLKRGTVGGLPRNATTSYRNAVDENLATSWSPPRERLQSGSWFGLDLLWLGLHERFRIFLSGVDSLAGRVVLESSCSLKEEWQPILSAQWLWANESQNLSLRSGSATFNKTVLRNIRMRLIAPLAAHESLAIHDIRVD